MVERSTDMRDSADDGAVPSVELHGDDEDHEHASYRPRPSADVLTVPAKSEVCALDSFTSVQYGFQRRGLYEHSKKFTNIMAMTYNGRMHQFVLMDTKGITAWNKDAVNLAITRPLNYPKYEYRIFKDIIYARKYNVYFALCKDFSLKVLNRDFEETCSSSADLRSVLFMTFNSVKDELITGGVDGTRVWKFKQATEQNWGEIKEMANYYLSLERHIKTGGEQWVRKVILEQTLQHLYYCNDTDLLCYHMEDSLRPIFTIEKAHSMSITGCCYSANARLLVTSSADCEVKAWSMTGGLVHTFRGHAKAVTDVLTHPEDSSLVITCSLDGSARTWSLNTMTCIYSLQVSSDGVRYMGLTDDKLLYFGTSRTVSVWSVSMVTSFWAHSRSQVSSLQLVPGPGKSTRLVAVGEDASVRVFARPSRMNLSTVLPPPSVSPLQKVKQMIYNRVMNIVYVLINERDLWLYTSKTDPACRLMVWNLVKIQKKLLSERNEAEADSSKQNVKRGISAQALGHRVTEFGLGNELYSNVTCIGCLDSAVEIWTSKGVHTPDQENFLMLGLEDGRILCMDPVVKGRKIFEFRASKNPIKDMKHSQSYDLLITLCKGVGAEHFQFWSLPSFALIYEVSLFLTVNHYALLEECLMTGHEDGSVHLHKLIKVENQQSQARAGRRTSEAENGHPEHSGPVTSVDACREMNIFLTCSTDGTLKIWDIEKTLLSELSLDSTLSCACFLNPKADIVIGFQNQIFYIDGRKVCPYSRTFEEDDIPSDTESEIHEDPAVLFEGVEKEDDGPVDMKNYLRHFKREVIQSYVAQDKRSRHKVKNDHDEPSQEAEPPPSPAPSELYRSRQSSVCRLSEVDMKLSARMRPDDVKDFFEDGLKFSQSTMFELPQFGDSPGPTPAPSTPSTPRTPTSILSVSEGGESTDYELEEEEDEMTVASTAAVRAGKREDKTHEPVTVVPVDEEKQKSQIPTFDHKSRAADIVIDAAALLKEEAVRAKKSSVGRKSEPSQSVGTPSVPPSSQGSRASSAAIVKKKALEGPRKRPKGRQVPELKKDSPEPPSIVPAEPAVQKKAPLLKRRTRGFLEMEIDTKEKEAETLSKYDMTYEFESRRHEVDMSSVIDKLEAPEPEQIPDSPPPAVSMQDITFQNSKSSKMNKQGNKRGRTKSRQRVQHIKDAAGEATRSKPRTGAGNRRRRGSQERTESISNRLRKTKSEEQPIPLGSNQLNMHSSDEVAQLVPHNQGQRKPSEFSIDLPTMIDDEKRYRNRSRSVPLLDQFPPQFDTRSRTPAFLRDDDSGWNFMMEGANGKHNVDDDDVNVRLLGSHPTTSFGGRRRPHTPADQLIRPVRPQLDHISQLFNFSHGDMELNFMEELQKYEGIPGTEDLIAGLHKNDGLHFDNSWHEKAITRHVLLKLQRELRARSAAEKRRNVDAERAVQQMNLSYHRDCSTPGPNLVPEYNVHWKKTRAQTAPTSKGRQFPLARPNTAVASAHAMPVVEPAYNTNHVQRNELGSVQPFRLKLKSNPLAVEHHTKTSTNEIDLQMYDPRNAAARAFLLYPSKSIPSKCSRYILVTQEDSESAMLATPMEERLIEERFPELHGHWLDQPTGDKLKLKNQRLSTVSSTPAF